MAPRLGVPNLGLLDRTEILVDGVQDRRGKFPAIVFAGQALSEGVKLQVSAWLAGWGTSCCMIGTEMVRLLAMMK